MCDIYDITYPEIFRDKYLHEVAQRIITITLRKSVIRLVTYLLYLKE